MPFFLSSAARIRAVDALLLPIRTTPGSLMIADSAFNPLVVFTNVLMSDADSSGFSSSNALSDTPAMATGVATYWALRENNGTVIVQGDCGQRIKIAAGGISKPSSTITVNGNHSGTFLPRVPVTLVNLNNATHNIYSVVASGGATYFPATDTTVIPIAESLDNPLYSSFTWTHIHVGEAGLDNLNIMEDQLVRVTSFRVTVR